MSIKSRTLLSAGLALSLCASASAGQKEDSHARLSDLSSLIELLKQGSDSDALQAAVNEQTTLSESLGGDRAVSSAGGVSDPNVIRSAPAGPPDTVTTLTGFSDAPGSAITTGTPVAATLVVTTTDTYLWDVDLSVNIPHTFAADLDISLTSPAGTTITITTDNGGGNDDVFAGTLFDDDAVDTGVNNLATEFTYANMTVATPLGVESALAAFVGEDPNGTWTLNIADDAGGDDGTLVDWSLDITTLDQTPIDTIVMGSNAPGAAITTGTPVNDVINIVSTGTTVCDVNMTTNITHTFASDLDMTLTSPAGTVVSLSTDNGGGNDDIFNGTLWDDDALSGVNDFTHTNAVTSTPMVPEASMGAFIGEDPNGNWTLGIVDDAGGDDGTLASWSLEITTCVGVPPDADLSVALGSNAVEPVSTGDMFDVSITATNNGPGGSTGSTATMNLPGGAQFVSSACASEAGGVVTAAFGALANAAMATCDVTVQVSDPTDLTFTVSIVGNENDPNAANDADTLIISGQQQSDLSLTLSSNAMPPVSPGDQFDLTMTVNNAGPDDATGVVATAMLPAGTVLINSTCATAAGNTLNWSLGALASAGMASCVSTLQVNIAANLTITGAVSGDQVDPVPGNNASAPLAITGAAVSVPTMTVWGLLALMILLTVMTRRSLGRSRLQ